MPTQTKSTLGTLDFRFEGTITVQDEEHLAQIDATLRELKQQIQEFSGKGCVCMCIPDVQLEPAWESRKRNRG